MDEREREEAVIDAAEESFRSRHARRLEGHLGDLCLRSLLRSPGRTVVVDYAAERKELKAAMFVAAAAALACRWRKRIPERRVGVVLPAGLGSMLVNLALVLMDKVPVNLNFTIGRSAVKSGIERAGIETVITAATMQERVGDFPWPEHIVDLMRERAEMGKRPVIPWLLAARLMRGGVMGRILGVPRTAGRREAGVLFSSGSTGEPSGIVLTHSNVIANCLQIEETGLLNAREKLLSCLPPFHSFGFTVGMWYPMYAGVSVVSVPSPLETKRIAEVIAAENATVLPAAPTFLRPFLKRVEPEMLQSLKCVVSGAEKTPAGLDQRWERTFGMPYLEGYGITETAPVVAVNLPERRRRGSVGALMPGMCARIVDPSSGEPCGIDDIGMLELRGPNIFPGYLGQEKKSAEAFRDGWYVTGDLARIDSDGFLYIEGRLKRFSKIGGEMVPHGRVEEAVAEALGIEDSETPQIAVTGIEDPSKGETLVLLTTLELAADQLREKLVAQGIPNLWIPRKIRKVDRIPVLSSGKLDLQQVQQLSSQVK